MKLIILYGPPAAGKLTIATELSKIADIKVFDNHQVIDVIEPIVTRSYPDFAKLIYQTQRNIIEAAVIANQTNVVITFPYAANLERDVEFISSLTEWTRDHGSEAYPVFLKCDTDTLIKRALEPSRKAKGKITTTEVMSQMVAKYDFNTPLEIEGNVILDTQQLSAASVADKIKEIGGL